jgi:hypothetical protein
MEQDKSNVVNLFKQSEPDNAQSKPSHSHPAPVTQIILDHAQLSACHFTFHYGNAEDLTHLKAEVSRLALLLENK